MEDTQPTPRSDSELDEILTEYGKRDQFLEPMARQTAKTALLQWAGRRAEKLVVEAENRGEYRLIRQLEQFTMKMDDNYGEFECLDDIEEHLGARAAALTATKEEE